MDEKDRLIILGSAAVIFLSVLVVFLLFRGGVGGSVSVKDRMSGLIEKSVISESRVENERFRQVLNEALSSNDTESKEALLWNLKAGCQFSKSEVQKQNFREAYQLYYSSFDKDFIKDREQYYEGTGSPYVWYCG